ncbi:MAG: hypothetical protein KDB27_30355, partial [Planctomycetales bacterium]|nr:hypothetical protein [Planctomycetales bacterium]
GLPIQTRPSLVDEFYDNTFTKETTIRVSGSTTRSSNWQRVGNLTGYQLNGDTQILAGHTITIDPQLAVHSQYSSLWWIVDGTLNADGVEFTGYTDIRVRDGGTAHFQNITQIDGDQIEFGSGSRGSVENSQFGSAELEVLSPNVSVSGNTFELGLPIQTRPSLVDEFYDNTFTKETTIRVSGSTTRSSNWQRVGNLTGYQLNGDTQIAAGHTITIDPELTVHSQYSSLWWIVDGTLNADGVEFTGYTDIRVRDGGAAHFQNATISGDSIAFAGQTVGAIHQSTVIGIPIEMTSQSDVSIVCSDLSDTRIELVGNNAIGFDVLGNWWGTVDQQSIYQKIHDYGDDTSRPIVNVDPITGSSCSHEKGAISGRAWADWDGNGSFDISKELGVSDSVVFLDLDLDGVMSETEPSTRTGIAGRFAFADMPAGDYDVILLPANGWQSTGNRTYRVSVVANRVTDAVNFSLTDSFPGDLDASGAIDARDVDLLCAHIARDEPLAMPKFDLDQNLEKNKADIRFLIEQVFGSAIGDSNMDGRFNSSDLVSVFQFGQYEDGIPNNSTWASGDWDCNGEFDSSDLVFAFQAKGYSNE